MRILTVMLFLGLTSGCAMDDFFVGDYDDDYLDSEIAVYQGTSPGNQQLVPSGQPAQNPQSPAAPPVQTREPPR